MQFEYTVTTDDIKNYSRDVVLTKQYIQMSLDSTRLRHIILSIFIGLIFITIMFLYSNIPPLKCLLMLIIVIPVQYILYRLLVIVNAFIFAPIIINKILQDKVDTKRTLNINENGIEITKNDISSNIPWNAVKKKEIGKHSILLFLSQTEVINIPKRIFNSEEEINNFWNQIQKY